MLTSLSIQNIVLIEFLALEFHKGLTVLTGETGAGKSILLDSVSLCLGARGDAALVRQGAQQGQVTAIFDLYAYNDSNHHNDMHENLRKLFDELVRSSCCLALARF